MSLNTKLGKIELKNPVLLASGTCGVVGREFEPYFNISDLGGIVTKSISIKPRLGNPTPRVVEIPNCGILNSIGLQNPGIDVFLQDELPYLVEKKATVVLNVVGESLEDYLAVVEKVKAKTEISAIELNLSCPNVDGGLDFSRDSKKTYELVSEVKKLTSIPIWTKLSPNVTDITEIAKGAVDAGVSGLTLINTVIGLALDKRTLKPILPRATGGYSGAAIKPIALRMVYQTYKRFPSVPIIGIGGVHTAEDAIEFLACGASAIQIGTANFTNPKTSVNIIEELKIYLTKNKINSISELIGKAHEKELISKH